MNEKFALELELAKHFMQWVTMRDPTRVRKLDVDKRRRRPDFAFYYASGQRYTVEIKRWLTPKLRQLQAQAEKSIAKLLQNRLNGTFVLDIPFDKFKEGQISKKEARRMISEILQITNPGMKTETHLRSAGSISKVSDDGRRLVPMVIRAELPVNLDENNQEVIILREKLEEIVLETREKFRWYRGTRVLVMDISQCGLDIDEHAGISKQGPGIVCRWLEKLLKPSERIDYVCLGQGMRLWKGDGRDRILTGHKYVDKPVPNYQEVWRRPGLPHILSSFIDSSSNTC